LFLIILCNNVYGDIEILKFFLILLNFPGTLCLIWGVWFLRTFFSPLVYGCPEDAVKGITVGMVCGRSRTAGSNHNTPHHPFRDSCVTGHLGGERRDHAES